MVFTLKILNDFFFCRLMGNEKWNIIIRMRQLLSEVFEKLSYIYYQKASEILVMLPKSVLNNCILTKLDFETVCTDNNDSYEVLRVRQIR